MALAYLKTPIGKIEIRGNNTFISSIQFIDRSSQGQESSNTILKECRNQLKEFFEEHRQSFDIPVNPMGSDFQRHVWQLIREIPFGRTTTYAEIAAKLGSTSMTRAVGNANSKNPLLIIIPCHRVIGADGSLTGFAAGVDRKRWLLNYERNVISQQLQLL